MLISSAAAADDYRQDVITNLNLHRPFNDSTAPPPSQQEAARAGSIDYNGAPAFNIPAIATSVVRLLKRQSNLVTPTDSVKRRRLEPSPSPSPFGESFLY